MYRYHLPPVHSSIIRLTVSRAGLSYISSSLTMLGWLMSGAYIIVTQGEKIYKHAKHDAS
jgi:hypothetical protein